MSRHRVPRKVSNALTVQHDRVMYLLDDTPVCRGLIHEYVEVVEYPDGVIEIQASGVTLPYRQYDRIMRSTAKPDIFYMVASRLNGPLNAAKLPCKWEPTI
ncbi:hypothetical protein [Paraburkholderia azotifigens]|uniref:hypothetical protein n=1 Tax=Paraburkholderia azotifigens TaxID=2057004 RepID=UPI003B8A5B18